MYNQHFFVFFLLDLLQPVLFSLYGNQYELREEYLLLTMFQVSVFAVHMVRYKPLINFLHPNIMMHILHTVLYTFPY